MAQARGTGSRGSTSDSGRPGASARERILAAAGELFAEHGFEATPTSRIAERAEVPKGLIHYYFRRKQDLLTALVDRLPEDPVLSERVVVRGDVAGSLRRLVRELDARLEASPLLSHLLWREADTHIAVREALQQRFRHVVEQIRGVIELALPPGRISGDVDTAALLLARVVNHRHSLVRHGAHDDELDREIGFIARALESGIGKPRKIKPA
ncbi:DNA-binding transcriptional regulator, AcrR family [Saccharopolyspora antimicrobica]|uniref:DNA-binding transcriptional regulator, AcrR family n=1 Tax=Saccharopolyspora antimicrobica TaxID=455193 RepID=A0A1I4THI9_9PSEU|nr:TetR/AcrR family transcriptional regulator [Saccharopolyspora antimicrobica]RKT85718.1 TetR family transcriptional regulator [Saccharopolyspora antimicrobica]SFM76115.1 DNA-binding transcriptional regulator, AcrR family [Saccharopolyspora antimicrobica]